MHFLSSLHLNTLSFFLRSYSKLKCIPSTFKVLASTTLLGHLILHHTPSWNVITQKTCWPSSLQSQILRRQKSGQHHWQIYPDFPSWGIDNSPVCGRKKINCHYPVHNNDIFSVLPWRKKNVSIRFPSLWRWYRKEAIASWSYITPNSSQMGISQSFNKWY